MIREVETKMNFWFWAFVLATFVYVFSMLLVVERLKMLREKLHEANHFLSSHVSLPPARVRLRVVKGGSEADGRRTDD